MDFTGFMDGSKLSRMKSNQEYTMDSFSGNVSKRNMKFLIHRNVSNEIFRWNVKDKSILWNFSREDKGKSKLVMLDCILASETQFSWQKLPG